MRNEPTTTAMYKQESSQDGIEQAIRNVAFILTAICVMGCTKTKNECVPFEVLDHHTSMCHAAVVFVGRVSKLEVDENSDPHGLLTTGLFVVESAIHGEVDGAEQVLVRGGRVGTYEEYVSGYPFLEVGDRYLFALGSPRADGPGAIVGWTAVPEDACPTEEPELRASFNALCEQ